MLATMIPITREKPMPDAPPAKPTITFDDFAKLDLRVARIVEAEPHPNADKLLRLRLDDGSGTPRQICAGVKAFYDPADLVGKQIVIVANLEPRTLRGEESRGMLLAASIGGTEDRALALVGPWTEIDPGATVS
ncbi:MAG: methionine--tRNA ligase subunit beta [Planctomycetota bacterium]